MAPQVLEHPGTRTTKGYFMATQKSSAPAHPSTKEDLEKLEDQLAHELMDEEERQELLDRVLRARRRGRLA